MKLKKSFPKYISEFFVLFVAVFLGFIAENYRETLSEKKKESQLMRSFHSDLKADSIQIQEIIEENKRKFQAIDSFIKIRHLDFNQEPNLIQFYNHFNSIQMWNAVRFEPTLATLNQLKSTGVLSYAEPDLATTISAYDLSIEKNKFGSDTYYNHVEESFRMIYIMTDYIALWEDPPKIPPLLADETTLMKFFNLSNDLMYTIEAYLNHIYLMNNQISELILAIEDEYGF